MGPRVSPSGASGAATRTGPTGGSLAGFVLAALVGGSRAERGWDRRLRTALAAMVCGEIAIYACGLAWLARFALPVPLLEAGLLPFLPGDAYKLVLAALALPAGWRIVGR